jgi:hypothetical protein
MERIPKILIEMFANESAQARFVLSAAKDADLQYCPCDGIRPLVELANHLAQIPSLDFKFYTKKFESFEQVHASEEQLHRSSIEGILNVFDEGVNILRKHLEQLSDEDALKENLKAFYEQGPEKSWTHCIPEITTHIAMHKMQLWMYLKMAGVPVSMWTYYGVPHP